MTVATNPTPEQPKVDTNQPGAAVSKPQTIREFEAAMRGLGFSRAEAAAIATRGFKTASDADAIESDLLAELATAAQKLILKFES